MRDDRLFRKLIARFFRSQAESAKLREQLALLIEARRIVGVALRSPTGLVRSLTGEGHRHHHVIAAMRESGWTAAEIAGCEQGFIDATGVFLDRTRAYQVATATKQLKRKPGGYTGPELFSEDLW